MTEADCRPAYPKKTGAVSAKDPAPVCAYSSIGWFCFPRFRNLPALPSGNRDGMGADMRLRGPPPSSQSGRVMIAFLI